MSDKIKGSIIIVSLIGIIGCVWGLAITTMKHNKKESAINEEIKVLLKRIEDDLLTED